MKPPSLFLWKFWSTVVECEYWSSEWSWWENNSAWGSHDIAYMINRNLCEVIL